MSLKKSDIKRIIEIIKVYDGIVLNDFLAHDLDIKEYEKISIKLGILVKKLRALI